MVVLVMPDGASTWVVADEIEGDKLARITKLNNARDPLADVYLCEIKKTYVTDPEWERNHGVDREPFVGMYDGQTYEF